MILDGAGTPSNDQASEQIPDLAPDRIITRPNDLWKLGEHRLFCGDSRRRESFFNLMGTEIARLVFVDPPYNVKIRGHVSGNGRVKHREFAQASGEKTSAQFAKFLEESLALLAEHSADGSIHFVCSDWRHLDEMLDAGRRVYRELKNLVVWNKRTPGWARSTAASTSWFSFGNVGVPNTSTILNSAATGAIAAMSGPMPGRMPSALIGLRSWPCTQPSNLLRLLPMPFGTAPGTAISSSTVLVVAATGS